MTNRFVDQAKSQYGALEKLLSRLPGVGGYMDKELRRDADFKLRQMIAENLSQPLHDLATVQQKLLKEGGLLLLDECGTCVTRLQTLIDRVKSASYGYAGLFDAIKVREEQLDALNRFDISLAASVEKLQTGVSALTDALKSSDAKESLGTIIEQVTDLIDELTELFNKRNQAIIAPDLLTDSTYVPEVDPKLLKQ